MAQKMSNCPHVIYVNEHAWEDVKRKKQTQDECDNCEAHGPNLWLCLHDRCLYMGCGESAVDHSSRHAEEKGHPLTLNMTTFRIWCYTCESEVYKDRNNPPMIMGDRTLSLAPLPPPLSPDRPSSHPATPPRSPTPTHDESESDDDDETQKPRGLVGLQNIGNTCYMNSAIQSLSNCQPLTRFFLDCPGYVKTDKKPMLSKCYMKLMSEIWHKKRPSYVVPSSVASGIKIVHPMFRGFTQQDAQEFLRCFMDQIHEELKQVVTTPDSEIPTSDSSPDGDAVNSQDISEGEEEPEQTLRQSPQHRPKQLYHKVTCETEKPHTEPSDGEYETCESGQSSERNSAEPSLSGGDETSQSGSAHGEVLIRNAATIDERQSTDGLDIMKLAEEGSAVLDSKADAQSIVSRPDTEVDSGMGSSSSSTLMCSSQSNLSVNSDDVQSTSSSQWGCSSPVHSKTNKDLANKQQKQHESDASSQASSPVSPSSSMTSPLSSSSITPTNPTDIDVEFSDAASELDPLQNPQKMASKRSKCPPRSRSTSERSRQSQHGKSGKKKPQEYQSVISDIFDGRILSSVQCLTCERVSATRETFQDLSLPIPSKDYLHMIHASHGAAGGASSGSQNTKGSCGEVRLNQGWLSWILGWMKSWFWGPMITLSDCLATFFSADELKGDNMYSCEKCKKLRNGMKYSRVLKLPEILCIHLKRFRHEFMFSSKINSYVSFPLEGLDMGPYLHKNCADQVTLYDLVGVICHHGTAGGGHYTAYGQNYINAQWYEFDDQYVTEVDMQQVENCEAYVLFYRKRNEHMIPIRQKAEQIMEVQESTFLRFYISKQWINKFNTFAEPGPITNNDFLCHHGGVHPYKYSCVGDLVQEIPQKLWEYLHDSFGGGPAVNRLYMCDDCQQELEKLKTRQRTEMDTFVKLHEEFQNEEYSGKIYAISMNWFKEWESFVRGKTTDPPGPVDNSKICIVRNTQAALRMNSDYGQLSQEMWIFLLDIYGGGPELLIKQNRPPSPTVVIHKGSPEEESTGTGNRGSEIKT